MNPANNSYVFLSKVYDELMYDTDYDTWAAYIDTLIKKRIRSHADLFEAGCGTGNISIRLRKKGYHVIATDISEEMLDIASEKARELLSDVQFVKQDMRELKSEKKKDVVLACCDAVNYLINEKDLCSFFYSANNILKPNGILLFDISSEYKLKSILGNEFFFEDGEDVTYFWQNTLNEDDETVKMDITLFISEDNIYRRFDETHVQRAHNAEKIKQLLSQCGFGQVYAYSFLSENEYHKTDERIQFCATKKG